MAYDKVIDSAVLDADLLSVANAIRSKGGTSGNLAFPTGFVNAIAAIETGSVTVETHEITVASKLTGKGEYRPVLLQGSAFVKEHYAKDGLFMILRTISSTAGAYNLLAIAQANTALAKIGSSNYYGSLLMYNSGGTAIANAITVYKLSAATPYNAGLMGKSNGDVAICLPANRNLSAGTYELIIGVAE